MRIQALRVHQWLPSWDEFHYDPTTHKSKPADYFYIASFPAAVLRRLAYVNKREASGPRILDIGIQRLHDPGRSQKISRFVDAGYPWATLNTQQRDRFPNLQKPGWLPTSIVANLVTSQTERAGIHPVAEDVIRIEDKDGKYELVLPEGIEDPAWRPKGSLHPVDIVDGQHRLFAFEPNDPRGENFELPVVLFENLDISWQAYLFWIINITPVHINASFAYDLYPLLRTQDWLEPIEGPKTYRETRAQELTEVLWRHPKSPWQNRIGMLGREKGKVSQAAWVRSLTASFLGGRRGALFRAPLSDQDPTRVLPWSRPQQAAFLIELWSAIKSAVASTTETWAENLRTLGAEFEGEAAFEGSLTLLNTDQGIRGVLLAANDLFFKMALPLNLEQWQREEAREGIDLDEVTQSLEDLHRNYPSIPEVVALFASQLARFEWRSGVTPKLGDEIRTRQLIFRTGTGYAELRRYLLRFLAEGPSSDVQKVAAVLVSEPGFERERT